MSFDKTFPCDFNLLLHLFKLGSTVLLRHQWVKQEMALSHHRRLLLFRFQNKKRCPIFFPMKWCVVEFRKKQQKQKGPSCDSFCQNAKHKAERQTALFCKTVLSQVCVKIASFWNLCWSKRHTHTVSWRGFSVIQQHTDILNIYTYHVQ